MSESEKPQGKSGFSDLWNRWKHRVLPKDPANFVVAFSDADGKSKALSIHQEAEKNSGTSESKDQEERANGKTDSKVSRNDIEILSDGKGRRSQTVPFGSDNLRQSSPRLETRRRSHSNIELSASFDLQKEHLNSSRVDKNQNKPQKDSELGGNICNVGNGEPLANSDDKDYDQTHSNLSDTRELVKDTEIKNCASSSLSSSPTIQHGHVLRGEDQIQNPEMSFRQQLSQLRNRHTRDSKVSGTKVQSKSSGTLDDEWADIPSMDVVSMGSSQGDVTSSSTDESASGSSRDKVISKSSLEESSIEGAVEAEQSLPRSSKVWSSDQKGVYEMQLENLQEQLVDIMIENQTLAQKLQRYENSDIIPLLKKLEEERATNENLTKRCEALEGHLKNNRPMHQVSVDAEENGNDTTDGEETSSLQGDIDGPPATRWERFQNHVMDRIFTIMADFTEDGDESDSDAPTEGDELTVKKLKENLKRFQSGYEPGLLFFKAVSALVSWKSASNTFLAFVLYMYVVWRGLSATVLLGLMLWYLTTTYFISRGWTIQFSLLPYHLVEVTPDERPPLSMSDRFQLVLHVSRRVQNILGSLADQMEKIHNFLYWTNPDLTKKLYTNLLIAFVTSLFISGSTLLTMIGLFLGIKTFLINPVLKKYPRLKAKYSFEDKIFKEVPTMAELEQKRAIEETQQFLVPDIEGITIRFDGDETQDSEPASKRFKAFAETFNVPESEQPLPGWKEGKRCTLISKNTVTGAFKNGRLYLTKSFLCFEKSRLTKEGNMLIPLKDILRIEKAKPFNFLPGSGMSIEIHLSSADKPVLFGGMLRRNLIYDKLVETWQAAQRAIQHQNSSSSSHMEARPSTSQGEVKSRSGSHRERTSSQEAAADGSDSELDQPF